MKALYLNGCYYQFPEGIENINDFILYLKDDKNVFVSLKRYETENCVHPYYIHEEVKQVFVNISAVVEIEECEINVLSRCEYDERLWECVERVCKDCVSYEEGDDLKGHRDKLNLDGECFWKREI